MIPPRKVIASYLIFSLSHLCLGYAGKECPAAACCEGFPPVRLPFWLKGRQPENCGPPGFELSCSEKNQTLIEFPTSRKFVVTEINYESQYLDIADPGGCMAKRLKTLDVSGSPFTIFWSETFTLLNCSSRVEMQDLAPIDCLSSSAHYVYAVLASMDLMSLDLSSCGFIANVKASYSHNMSLPFYYGIYRFVPKPIYIPNEYPIRGYPKGNPFPKYVTFSDYLISLYNVTRLSWVIPGCDGCELGGGNCRFRSNTSRELECFIAEENHVPAHPLYPNKDKWTTKIKGVCIGIPIAIFSIVLTITLTFMYLRWRRVEAKENWKKIKKFLEERKSFNPTRYSFAYIQKITKEFKKKLRQGGYGSVFQGEA